MPDPLSREEEVPLHDNPDAMVWADEFMRRFGERKTEIDHGLMLAWFATAIMTGHDWAERQQRARIGALEEVLRVQGQNAAQAVKGYVAQLATLTAERDRLREVLADATQFVAEWVSPDDHEEVALLERLKAMRGEGE